jgi:hypothetical protein
MMPPRKPQKSISIGRKQTTINHGQEMVARRGKNTEKTNMKLRNEEGGEEK